MLAKGGGKRKEVQKGLLLCKHREKGGEKKKQMPCVAMVCGRVAGEGKTMRRSWGNSQKQVPPLVPLVFWCSVRATREDSEGGDWFQLVGPGARGCTSPWPGQPMSSLPSREGCLFRGVMWTQCLPGTLCCLRRCWFCWEGTGEGCAGSWHQEVK